MVNPKVVSNGKLIIKQSNLNFEYYDFVINILHDVKHWKRSTDLADLMVSAGYKVLILTNSNDAVGLVNKNTEHEIINIKNVARALGDFLDIEDEWSKLSTSFGLNQSINKFVELECVQNLPAYKSKKDLLIYTIKLFKAYELIFEKIKINYFFQLLASDVERRVFFLAGKKFAEESMQYTQSVIPDKEIFFVGMDGSADRLFINEIKRNDFQSDLSVDEIFEKMETNKRNGRYLSRGKLTAIASIKSFHLIKERVLGANKIEYLKRNFCRFIVVPVRKQIWKLYEGNVVSGEKYIFYPMHAPGEDTVIVRSFPNIDEFALIKVISMSLPAEVKLYVKQHPGWEGWHSISDLAKLKKIEEVRLISSETSSHKIIKNSLGCVVLNSSVWFESLMLSKPVICLGSGIFTGLNVVREVIDLRCLDLEISKMIKNTTNHKIIEKFIGAMSNLSYSGVYHYHHGTKMATQKLFVALIKHTTRLKDFSRSESDEIL
jgi:hypothetical protein